MSVNKDFVSDGFPGIVEYCTKNRDKPWQKWLDFSRVFEKPGKQGIVGIMKTKNNDELVFKISQYINYLIRHEAVVMQSLNELAIYCPHFSKYLGIITCDVEPKCRKEGKDPFTIISKYPIEKEALLCEYIDKSYKFYNYIRSDKIEEKILYSTIKQVLMAIAIAQKKKQFSHYDLHSFNIMMRRCNPNSAFLYVLDSENQFAVPTNGHYPVIIDYGFSYIKDMDDGPFWGSMAHTDVGFFSDRFDWVADPKLFLVTVSGEIKNKRDTENAKKLRRVVRNLFSSLKIDWDSGWDNETEMGATDYVLQLVSDYNPGSIIFDDYEHYCIDILQSLVILPFEQQEYSDIHKHYEIFLKEFIKIETQISSSFYNLYILKCIVDAARYVRAAYLSKTDRTESILQFQKDVGKAVNKVANFCVLDKVHMERMLCSLYLLGKGIEGVLYDVVNTRMREKEKLYKKLPLKSIEQIFAAVDVNIQDDFVYDESTQILIFDSITEEYKSVKIPSEIVTTVNDLHPIVRGSYIYDYLYK